MGFSQCSAYQTAGTRDIGLAAVVRIYESDSSEHSECHQWSKPQERTGTCCQSRRASAGAGKAGCCSPELSQCLTHRGTSVRRTAAEGSLVRLSHLPFLPVAASRSCPSCLETCTSPAPTVSNVALGTLWVCGNGNAPWRRCRSHRPETARTDPCTQA